MSQPVTEEAFKSLEFERHTVARERNPGFELTWASVGGGNYCLETSSIQFVPGSRPGDSTYARSTHSVPPTTIARKFLRLKPGTNEQRPFRGSIFFVLKSVKRDIVGQRTRE